jgi:adenylylsulfate kinase
MAYFAGRRMILIQLTGLSGAGKTTLAEGLRIWLSPRGISLRVIDGDVYRRMPGWNLGFSPEDRREQIRRLGEVANGFLQKGEPAIIAAINPYASARKALREAHTVWVRCSIAELLKRDTKGLYARAFLPDGHPDKLLGLTGVNDPYEAPDDADLILDTDLEDPAESIEKLGVFFMELWQAQGLKAGV